MNGKLIVSEGDRDRVHEIIEDRVVIGTGIEADLHLRQADIAPLHCGIRRLPQGFKLVDLESTGGTRVNGHPVNQHFLQDGDSIEVGKARITYLGSSAAPPARPRRAPPEPLKVHPTDEEGRPRRFYRHESLSSGLGTGPKLALILAGLSILALILVWLGQSRPREEGIRQWTEANRLMARGDEHSLREAIRLFKSIPKGEFDERRIRDALDVAEEDLRQITVGREDSRTEKEYRRILDYHLAHAKDLGYLRSQVEVFGSRHPDSSYLVDLKARLRVLEAGGAEKVAAWETGQEALQAARKKGNFQQAFQILAGLEADKAIVRTHGARLGTYRAILEREFRDHYASMAAQALDAHQQGDPEKASRIYQALADVGCEPWSSQARRLLEKLK